MIINSHETSNPKIKIIEILSELTGNAAVRLKTCVYAYLDDNDRYFLIDLKHVKKIDSLGFQIFEFFINRGVQIRLFNVDEDIRQMFRISRKEYLFKIYNKTDYKEATHMFEKEILEEKAIADEVMNRRYPRVDTFFKVDFKYHPGHNGVISGRASILNLSEGGMFADQVLTIDKTGRIVVPPKMEGYELYDLEFNLNGNSDLIETKGECVREFKTHEKLCTGIRFKDMKQDHKQIIRDYVFNTYKTQM